MKSEQLEKENESIHLQHIRDCKKEEHSGEGYLHSPDDNSHYDVDGLAYCGKCHSWVNDWQAQFLSDCTHDLVGQTVELLEVT